jgi:NDP-sugar pyrophosphorylase family protein
LSKEAAILLAAGKGERLRPITSTRPKPSIPIGAEPIICRHLKALSKTVSRLVVVTSYMSDVISKVVAKCSEKYNFGTNIEIVDQGQELGTGHAVLVGARKIIEECKPRSIIVAYSDIYLPANKYYEFLEGDYEILLSPVERPWEYGVVKVENNLVRSIVEKPAKGEEPSNLVFSGLLRITVGEINKLENLNLSPRGEYELTDLITIMGMERGLKPLVLKTNEWMDIGRPWDLLEANNNAILECIQTNCQETPEFQIKESDNGKPFVVHQKAVIEKNSTVYGPALVGNTARLKPYAFISS